MDETRKHSDQVAIPEHNQVCNEKSFHISFDSLLLHPSIHSKSKSNPIQSSSHTSHTTFSLIWRNNGTIKTYKNAIIVVIIISIFHTFNPPDQNPRSRTTTTLYYISNPIQKRTCSWVIIVYSIKKISFFSSIFSPLKGIHKHTMLVSVCVPVCVCVKFEKKPFILCHCN